MHLLSNLSHVSETLQHKDLAEADIPYIMHILSNLSQVSETLQHKDLAKVAKMPANMHIFHATGIYRHLWQIWWQIWHIW